MDSRTRADLLNASFKKSLFCTSHVTVTELKLMDFYNNVHYCQNKSQVVIQRNMSRISYHITRMREKTPGHLRGDYITCTIKLIIKSFRTKESDTLVMQMCFHSRKSLFDRVEVWRVCREIFNMAACCFISWCQDISKEGIP